MMPFVSVLVNTYNYARYVEEAVESALQQDYPSDRREVIVVDDGSTDDTADRLRRFGSAIRYIYQTNQGQAQACNTGIAASRGEIICFLDSDDAWYRHKLRRVVQEFTANPAADVVFHTLEIELDNGSRVGVTPDNTDRDAVVRLTPAEYLQAFYRVAAPTSALSIRRSCLERMMPIPSQLRISADAYLHRASVVWARGIVLIRQPLGKYRKHGESHPFGLTSSQRVRTTLDVHRRVAEALKPELQKQNTISPTLQSFLEFEMKQLEIFALNLEGLKLRALREAWRIEPFPRRRSALATLEARAACVLSAILPQGLFFRLKHWFRKVKPFHPIKTDTTA